MQHGGGDISLKQHVAPSAGESNETCYVSQVAENVVKSNS